jgi:hypothetical protein
MNASDVAFEPANMYATNPPVRTSIITLVINQAPGTAASATVVYVGHISHRNRTADEGFQERLAHQPQRQSAALYR